MQDSNPSDLRRGLVLEGGGAKGAWQFGALKALYESGVKFDYVAGTSVGALNGALWAADRMDLGEELWGSLRRSRVFRFRPHHSPIFFLGLFSRVFYAYVNGFLTAEMAPRSLRVALKGLMSLPSVIISIYIALFVFEGMTRHIATSSGWKQTVSGVILAAIFVCGSIYFLWDEPARRLFFYASVAAVLVLVCQLLFYVIGIFDAGSRSPSTLSDHLFTYFLEMPIVPLIVATIPLTIFGTAVLTRKLNASLFDVNPLEQIIRDLLTGGFKTPVFATVVREIDEYYDPDDVRYRYTSTNFSEAISSSALLPVYLRVDRLDAEDALTTLLATSALPLGITPRRGAGHVIDPEEIRAKEWSTKNAEAEFLRTRVIPEGSHGLKASLMDGGVVDNRPWHPLIVECPCDELVIVGCGPIPAWDDSQKQLEWTLKDRFLRVVKSSLKFDGTNSQFDEEVAAKPGIGFFVDENGVVSVYDRANETQTFEMLKGGVAANIKNDPPRIVPRRSPPTWPSKVVIIAPDQPLGNFLTGTLNFSRDAARKRIADGYRTATQILQVELPELDGN